MLQTENITTKHDEIPSLLTVREVAQLLRIGRSTVYQLLQRGDLTNIRIGRSVRVRLEDLQKFIELNASNKEK